MKQQARLVLRVLIGVVTAMAFTALIEPSTDPYPLNRIQSMPDNFRKGWANLAVVELALHDYYVFEGRLPTTLDELFKSDEMPVRPEDLTNPYTGKPVKSVLTLRPVTSGTSTSPMLSPGRTCTSRSSSTRPVQGHRPEDVVHLSRH